MYCNIILLFFYHIVEFLLVYLDLIYDANVFNTAFTGYSSGLNL